MKPEMPFIMHMVGYTKESPGGYIDKIELPSGDVMEFNEAVGRIEFEPLSDFVGYLFTIVKNGVPTEKAILERLLDTERGKAFEYTVVETIKGDESNVGYYSKEASGVQKAVS